ncbi:MAG: hypothetical protein TYPL_5110 [Candidatus Tyloplasma litorale]|nr:MAG: hypothetical protein TYPL_5110 [Mycoplasmatales bacterium]
MITILLFGLFFYLPFESLFNPIICFFIFVTLSMQNFLLKRKFYHYFKNNLKITNNNQNLEIIIFLSIFIYTIILFVIVFTIYLLLSVYTNQSLEITKEGFKYFRWDLLFLYFIELFLVTYFINNFLIKLKISDKTYFEIIFGIIIFIIVSGGIISQSLVNVQEHTGIIEDKHYDLNLNKLWEVNIIINPFYSINQFFLQLIRTGADWGSRRAIDPIKYPIVMFFHKSETIRRNYIMYAQYIWIFVLFIIYLIDIKIRK